MSSTGRRVQETSHPSQLIVLAHLLSPTLYLLWFSSILVISFRASPSACNISSSLACMACVSRCSARWITNVINQVANVAMACQSSPLGFKYEPENSVDQQNPESEWASGEDAKSS